MMNRLNVAKKLMICALSVLGSAVVLAAVSDTVFSTFTVELDKSLVSSATYTYWSAPSYTSKTITSTETRSSLNTGTSHYLGVSAIATVNDNGYEGRFSATEVRYKSKSDSTVVTTNYGPFAVGGTFTPTGESPSMHQMTIHVYAVPKTFDIVYETNGGTINGDHATTYTFATGATLPTNVTRANYAFAGWYANPGLSGAPIASVGGTEYGVKTYYAKWTPVNYTLTVNATAGGTVSGGGTYAYGSTPTLTATPSTGYHFVRWSDGSTDAVHSVTVTGDATYTATFEVNYYAITVNATSGGSVSGGGTYAYGSTPTLTATPSTGFHFVQWSDGSTEATRSVTVTGEATYTATFAASDYTISTGVYHEKGGTVTGGGNYAYGTQITLTATPDTGYWFDRWSDGSRENPRTVTVTQSATYTAEFSPAEYQLTLDNQGADISGHTRVTAEYGEALPPIVPPEKNGYDFGGYFASPNGVGTQYYKPDGSWRGNAWQQDSNGTLYALWIPHAYTVRFDAGGASGTMADMALHYGEETNLVANAFTTNGYLFAGWVTNGSPDVAYADEALVSNLTTVADGVFTLKAAWTNGIYFVRFDSNAADAQGSMDVEEFVYDEGRALTPNAYTREGYDFMGWATEAAAPTAQYADEAVVTNLAADAGVTTTLYAVWKPESYDVTLDANGARGGYFETPGTATKQVVVVYTTVYDLPTPQNEDKRMSFAGWRDELTGEILSAQDTVPLRSAGHLSFKAVWSDALAIALDAPELEFETGCSETTSKWFVQTETSLYGGSAAQVGAKMTEGDARTWIQLDVPANKVLTFDWRLDDPQESLFTLGKFFGNRLYLSLNDPIYENEDMYNGIVVSALTNSVLDNKSGEYISEDKSGQWFAVAYTNNGDSAVTVYWVLEATDSVIDGGTAYLDHVTLTDISEDPVLKPGKVPLGNGPGGSPFILSGSSTIVSITNAVKGWWYGLYSKTNLADKAEKWTLLPAPDAGHPTAVQAAADDEPISFSWDWSSCGDPMRFFKLILSEEDPR